MPENVAQQRCWNHPVRGAVCRCPVCHRFFCRECVSEHDTQLLCATCIKTCTPAAAESHKRARRFWLAALGLAIAVLAWIAFFSLGQVLMGSATVAERSAWHNH